MDDKERRWTGMYWDVFSEVRWSPSLIGLKNITGWKWDETNGQFVPRGCKSPKGSKTRSIYYQAISNGEGQERDDALTEHVQSREELFNGLLDLVTSIVPGSVLSDLFDPLVRLNGQRDYRAFGRDIYSRFDPVRVDGLVQQDGFLTAQDSLVAIEIKFDAETSLKQFGKYCLLVLLEEEQTGERASVNLLYIVPKKRVGVVERNLGLPLEASDETTIDEFLAEMKSRTRELLTERREALTELLDRLRVRVVSWSDLEASLRRKVAELGDSDGDRTLANLLVGFADEIEANPETGTAQ